MSYGWFHILLVISSQTIPTRASDVCSNSTVSALSVEGALVSVLQCTYSVRTLVYTKQTDIDLSVAACLNQLAALDPAKSPIAISECRLCYQVLITDLLSLMAGKMVSGAFVSSASSLKTSCGSLSTQSGRERCMKHPDVVPLLLTFQKCAGYSILYPTSVSLALRRQLVRADVFKSTLQLGLGRITTLPSSLTQITNVVNNPSTPQNILNLQMCYLTFVADVTSVSSKLSTTVNSDCSSNNPTTVCSSDENIAAAMARFVKCSGFEINQFPIACTNSTSVDNVFENYDVLATAVPFIQANYSTDLTSFFDSFTRNITNYTTADCAQCFRELAVDAQTNILNQQSTMPEYIFSAYLSLCTDPHSAQCAGLIGINGLNNFQQCSGVPLNITKMKATIPAPVVNTTVPPTTPPPTEVNGYLLSITPSTILLSFSVIVALAL